MASDKQQVVILGAGYLGVGAAVALDKANKKRAFDITIVSPREDFMLHKIGALRAAVRGEEAWHERVMVPLQDVFKTNKSGRIVRGLAASVDEQNKTVTLQDGQVLKWDVLLVATGSASATPAEPAPSSTSGNGDRAAQKAYFADFAAALKRSKSVLVVGAGPAGIELAGEILAVDSAKQVHIVTRAADILDTATPLPPKGKLAVRRLVERSGVKLVFGDEYENKTADQHWIEVKEEGGVTLKSGLKLAGVDLVVFATGVKVATGFLPPTWLDASSGEVVIDPATFQLQANPSVFAAGDAAKTNFTKLGYIAMGDAPVVAKNILAQLEGKPVKNKVSRPKQGGIIITYGPNKGRALFPGMTLGDFLTKNIKSKDLFVGMVWGANQVTSKPPKA